MHLVYSFERNLIAKSLVILYGSVRWGLSFFIVIFRYKIQPRVLQDVSDTDLHCEILNSSVECPIGIAPTGFHFFAHEDAEIATALGIGIIIIACI